MLPNARSWFRISVCTWVSVVSHVIQIHVIEINALHIIRVWHYIGFLDVFSILFTFYCNYKLKYDLGQTTGYTGYMFYTHFRGHLANRNKLSDKGDTVAVKSQCIFWAKLMSTELTNTLRFHYAALACFKIIFVTKFIFGESVLDS